MKKLITIALLFITIHSFAQEVITKEKSHELKLNAFNVILFKSIDASYEYLINEESSVGVSLLINLNDENTDGPDYNEKFAITPYYRHFFSQKYAWGFFVEGFGMFNTQELNHYHDDINGGYDNDEKTTNFALGLSLGAKLISEHGFVFEFFGGAGRNLFTNNSDYNTEIVPRLGVSFGYRF